MRLLLIFSAIFLAFSATPALAQLDLNGLNGTELTIDLEPEYPRPGEQVTATINDYRGGAYGSSITWIFDGQVIPDADNRRNTSFTAGVAGVTQTIEAVLTKPQGGREVVRNSITPIYLDIILEPQTRVPEFYLGRSLPSVDSVINATAIVSTDEILNPDLVYTWRLNQKVIEGGPLRGGNQVSFSTPMGSEAILSLQVTRPNGEVLSRRAIIVPSVFPKMNFYEVSSLYGMRNVRVDQSATIIGNSLTVRAEPFYLDSRVYNDPDITEWEINGYKTKNTGSNPYEVTLQKTGASGVSTLEFHVRDTSQLLQGAQDSVRINF